MNTTDDFMDSLKASLAETGRDLGADLDKVRAKAAEQMAMLALSAGEPGYGRAVIAARDNVAMAAGLAAVRDADAADARIIGVIQGSLFFGAKVIAGGGAA